MLLWGFLLGFISAVVAGVLMGMLADWVQGEHSRRLGLSRPREPHTRIGGWTAGREPVQRS